MNIWDAYQERINAHGGTKRGAALQREIRRINNRLPDNLSYHTVTVDDVEQNVAVINSDNLNEKSIISMPGEDLVNGGLVHWMDNYWLITERDANMTVYTKCKMIQCNHLLKWVSEDGGAFRRESVTAADGTLQSEFTVAEQTMTLQAYIKVVGSHQYASYSNRSEVAFSTAERPAYFYLRKVSTSDDGSVVTVEAQTDPQFPGTDYKVYRAVGDGPAAVVAHCQPTTAGLLRWQDFSAHPLEQIYCYYLGVEDGCGRNEMYTRTGATLQLLIAEQGSSVAVAWNPYDGWEGATSYELLMQQADATTWTSVANTVATEAVVDIDGMHAGGSCRFKVVAAESSASRYQQGDTLQSAVFSHSPHVTLWLPNAFTPTESTNNLFGPCFQAIDADGYEFHIFNRQGLVVFSSRNPEERWDGRREGLLMPAGSYVYYITFRQGDGTVQQLKGTVTLIY